MNPLDHPISDELYFQIPSSDHVNNFSLAGPEDEIWHNNHDPYMMDVIESGSGVIPCTNQKGKGKQKQLLPPLDHENKKWMHRQIEKQRRQEMSRLCTTFRSLLPLQYIKGKRSTSDHMHEGVKYIEELKNKVDELQGKRDMLVNLSNNLVPESTSSGISSTSSTTSTNLPAAPTYVLVEPYPGGAQIKCSYSLSRKHALPLSRMLDIVLKQGLNVVNSTSIQTQDNRFIHTVRSEDPHMMMTETDYTELQRKLTGALISCSIN